MKKRIFLCIWVVLTVLTVAFIFNNSAQPVPESQKVSANVAETIASISPNGGEAPEGWSSFAAYIRKAAHAVEFFVLGTELSLLFFVLLKTRKLYSVWNVLSIVLCTAVADESIQILSGRGPRVQDILLDFSGGAVAMLLFFILFLIVCAVKTAVQKRKQVDV